MTPKRFRIAFSFAGEKRDFVEKIAAILAKRFSKDAILYDKATGREVGAVYMPAPQTGSPMTYILGGRQYIVVAISTPPMVGVPALVRWVAGPS